MRILAVICQVLIALGVGNVWLLRSGKPTRWRPEGADNMAEEFRHYGFPDWMRTFAGAAKLVVAALLILGIWYPPLAVVAGLAMALLMAVAVGAHLKVGDPLLKSLPSFTLLLLSLFVAYANSL
jgi:uncharacterized membrane protein YphA (DoxX/SURF4 family)